MIIKTCLDLLHGQTLQNTNAINPESTGGVSEEDPEPPPSQPANRVALKIAAKSDFLYLNFLFINNASDKTKLKDS
ncbi:TPA: hypothetical protein SHX23_003061 [Escherichia coli]|nr:hypothetical protein [Escherichia coli]